MNKEHLALRNNFRGTKKFLIAKFDCITDLISLFSGQESFSSCMADCEKVLPCTHKCKFKCLDCSYGQLHLPCEDNCVRTLICGHKCQGKCGEACQPCSRLKCLFQSCHHKKGPFTY